MEPINSEVLVRNGLITTEQLAEARRQKLTTKRTLGDVLVDLGYLTKEQVMEHLYQQLYSRIKEILEPLRDVELALADLYTKCAAIFPEKVDFWRTLVRDEEGHAQNIEEMIRIIYDRPQAFEIGLPIRKEAVLTFSAGVRDNLEKIRAGKIPPERILVVLKDIEQGLIESKYFDILKSNDASYNRFLMEIRKDTFSHRARLDTLKA